MITMYLSCVHENKRITDPMQDTRFLSLNLFWLKEEAAYFCPQCQGNVVLTIEYTPDVKDACEVPLRR